MHPHAKHTTDNKKALWHERWNCPLDQKSRILRGSQKFAWIFFHAVFESWWIESRSNPDVCRVARINLSGHDFCLRTWHGLPRWFTKVKKMRQKGWKRSIRKFITCLRKYKTGRLVTLRQRSVHDMRLIATIRNLSVSSDLVRSREYSVLASRWHGRWNGWAWRFHRLSCQLLCFSMETRWWYH